MEEEEQRGRRGEEEAARHKRTPKKVHGVKSSSAVYCREKIAPRLTKKGSQDESKDRGSDTLPIIARR